MTKRRADHLSKRNPAQRTRHLRLDYLANVVVQIRPEVAPLPEMTPPDTECVKLGLAEKVTACVLIIVFGLLALTLAVAI